jgi:hypothetical protein
MNHELTRKEALRAIGGGSLAALALAYGFSPTEAQALSTINLGVHPFYNADPNEPGMQRGFNVFAGQSGKRPFYYTAWTDPTKKHDDALHDYHGVNALNVADKLGVHLQLNFEIEPMRTNGDYFPQLLDGTGQTEAGINGDTYVMNVARHLKAWTDKTAHTVPVMLFHEFNWRYSPWGGPNVMPKLWKRYATIMRGGDVNANLAAINQAPLKTSKRVGVNNKLRFVFDILVGATTGTNWGNFYPGGSWVDQCGANVYPSPDPDRRTAQFKMLADFNAWADKRNKPLAIPEFNWAAHAGDDRTGPVRELLEWMINHAGRITYASQFESTSEFAVFRVGANPHPDLKKLYQSYYGRAVFRGD